MSDSLMRMPGMFSAMRIIEDINMTDTAEDWSRVRSPARARRRRKKHRQNIRYVKVPKSSFYKMGDAIVCHPEMANKLRAALKGGRGQ